MIDILLAFYRWPILVGATVCSLLATTFLGGVYFLVVAVSAFILLRREPWQWLQPKIERSYRFVVSLLEGW